MQIQPQSQFTIFRQIGDHTDPNRDSYYVVATIRLAATSEVLDTVTLINQSNGEYKKDWSVIPNTHPDGTWINIITSVYTDAALTTKSNKYSDTADSYLVRPFESHAGGGVDVDYSRIKKMIKEALPAPVEPLKLDLEPLNDTIKSIKTDISKINVPVVDQTVLETKLDIITMWLETLNNKLDDLTETIKYQ